MKNPKHPKTQSFLKSGLFEGLKTFSDLESRISDLPTKKERGDAFEVFAEAYLATQKIVQAENVWSFSATPQKILQKLALDTGRDMGVDGIIKNKLGTYCSYQVKFRTSRPSLLWSELSTFMGLSDQAGERILFTNCDDLPLLMNERKNFYCIRGNDLDRLEERDFKIICDWLASNDVTFKRKEPLPHQKEALENVFSKLDSHDRMTAIMACGTGKTLVSLWIAEYSEAKNIIVFVPSLALVRQTLHEWLRETLFKNLAYLCVCSDKTVKQSADEMLIRQSELDFPVTTDPEIVSEFLNKDFSGTKIIFSTYQSSHVIGQVMNGDFVFDLGILDEAHKTAGRQSKHTFPLDDNNIPIKKRIFFTATPRHYNPHQKDRYGEARIVYSMDNPEIYGPVAYTLTFGAAAKRGIICNYKVLISVITSDMVSDELLSRGETYIDGDWVRTRQVANQIALKNSVEKYGVSKIFTFHKSVNSAKSFTSNSSSGIKKHLSGFESYHVNGTMPTSMRERTMRDFRSAKNAVISNARCLTEGVDVPAVDMVAFLSPRRSRVDIVQATGRAMRKADGKKTGYILLPLYVEVAKSETVEAAIERADYSEVWDVLQALQEQDETLADEIQAMSIEKSKTKGFNDSKFRERVEIEGPEISLEILRKSITTRCLETFSTSWEKLYANLLIYKGKYGHCNVTKDEDKQLAAWAVAQRVWRRKGRLTGKRIELLDEIGFDWEYQSTKAEATWNRYCEKLKKYNNEHGHCNIPRTHHDSKLASWVWIQRQRYKGTASGEREITTRQIKRLEDIGFSWDRRDSQWLDNYEKLKLLVAKNGASIILETPEAKKSWGWFLKQLTDIEDNKLSEDRVELLKEFVNINLIDNAEIKWQERYEELKKYKEEFGDCKVPHRWEENSELANWVGAQRQFQREGKLEAGREESLNKIGFVWNLRNRETWEDGFEKLSEYKKSFGDCNVPMGWKEDKKLGRYVNAQRSKRKRGELSDERIAKLDSIDFQWAKNHGEKWEEKYLELLEYKEKHGDCNVPHHGNGNKKLGAWLTTQRVMRKDERLSKERIARLDSIGFVWDGVAGNSARYGTGWDDMYEALVLYKKRFGHCNVKNNWEENPKLAGWVYRQREIKKKGKLDDSRVEKLNEIEFVWALR